MAEANILNTRTINYMELIGNGKLYRVPPYQRDYSWSQEQWEDLWNDIVELRPRSEDRHYMGALVVEGKSDREFLVIDGQQRLATLSLHVLRATAGSKPTPFQTSARADEDDARCLYAPRRAGDAGGAICGGFGPESQLLDGIA